MQTLIAIGLVIASLQPAVTQFATSKDGTKIAYNVIEIVEDLGHPGEFEQVDRVFPRELAFTRAHAR